MTGTNEAQEVDTIPLRVNDLERSSTLTDHRLKQLEEEKLPNRVGSLETTTSQMASDLHEVRSSLGEIRSAQSNGREEMRIGLAKIESSGKTRSNIIVTLLSVLAIIIAAAGLLPKFDAVVVEKSQGKATIKE